MRTLPLVLAGLLATSSLASAERVHVPGTMNLVAATSPSATHCRGLHYGVARIKGPARADGAPLQRVLLVGFPEGLDFSERSRAASKARFEGWLADFQRLSAAAMTAYETTAKDASTLAGRVEAMARMIQVQQHFARVLEHAEIPRDLRRGAHAAEATKTYCEAMAGVAAPLRARAAAIATTCAETAAGAEGWWTSICTAKP